MASLELGLDTFGDATVDGDGRPLGHPAGASATWSTQAVLADRLGLDFFGVGEHHREDFAVSAPEVVLAAIAGRTERIRLGSAVTVLSSDDPVRVFQRFATLDAVSGGRAEVILGRGSFTESFPLFGYELEDYETLFEEKLDLFSLLLHEEPVTWSGRPGRRCGTSGSSRAPSTASHLDRRRRQPRVGDPGRPLRPAPHAGDHRRRPPPLRPLRRPLPPGAAGARPTGAADRHPQPRPRGRHRRRGTRRSTGSTTARCTGASGPSGAGPR